MAYEIVASAIGVVGTLLGVFLGSHISNKSAEKVVSRQAFSNLASSFSEELAALKTSTDEEMGSTSDLLSASHKKHLSAYLQLRASLSSKHRKSLGRLWQVYTQEDNNLIPEEREMYRFNHLYREKGQTEHEMRLLAIKHIEALTDFENTI